MAKFVIKRDGSKQVFDSEKIKRAIQLAAEQAGLEEDRVSEIVNQVAGSAIALADIKEEIATSEIREKILSDLDTVEPAVSAAWRGHDKENKGIE